MNNHTDKQSLQEQVLAMIKSGHVQMRPRWQHVLRATLASIGGVILLLFVAYLASFILYVLWRTGIWGVPVFGVRGWHAFFVSLPWVLIGLLVVFVVVLEILVKRHAFAYRRPLLFSAGGILCFVLFGGYLVAISSFHSRFYGFSVQHRVPFVGDFYREFDRHRFHDIHYGKITTMLPDGFKLENRRNELLTVIVTEQTRLPFGGIFSVGNSVVVFGERSGSTVQAFGVRIFRD